MESSRTKVEILKALANLTRFLDLKYDTNLHEQFTLWMKRKCLHWSCRPSYDNYQISKVIKLETVIEKLRSIRTKYKIFGLFVLCTGLRTTEAIKAFNNHSDLCQDGIMELFWDRRTKKANAVYCHPLLHDKITFTVSRKLYQDISRPKLGFDLRHLRKVNFTITATRIDPLLAEFMQGRRGNISQKHYFLPMMNEHKRKWIRVWEPIIKKFEFR